MMEENGGEEEEMKMSGRERKGEESRAKKRRGEDLGEDGGIMVVLGRETRR